MADKSFTTDTRAIEGLPIRLVIALVVGVAALSMMMTILDGVGDIGQTEITYTADDLTHSVDDNIDFTMEIVDENGNEITETTVIVTSGTAQMDGSQTFETGPDDNTIAVSIDSSSVELRQGQDTGTLSVDIIPPSDSDHADDSDNPDIVVYR